MAAIDKLEQRLIAVEEVADALRFESRSSLAGALSRAIAIESFVAAESFLVERAIEYASALTAMRISPTQMSSGAAALGRRLVAVLAKRLAGSDAATAQQLLKDVADSVASLSTSSLVVHPLQMGWTGSNLQSTDIPILLSLAGYKEEKAWSLLTHMWARIDGLQQSSVSLRSVFEDVANLRHEAAHNADPVLPLPNLLALPGNIARFACAFDLLMALGFHATRSTLPGRLSKPLQVSALKFRRVEERKQGWFELSPTGGRAIKRSDGRGEAVALAQARALKNSECLLVLAASGRPCDWAYPEF